MATKASLKKDAKAISTFDNLCSTLTSLSPAFLEQSIEQLVKEPISLEAKTVIAVKAKHVYAVEEEKGNVLPDSWMDLVLLDVNDDNFGGTLG